MTEDKKTLNRRELLNYFLPAAALAIAGFSPRVVNRNEKQAKRDSNLERSLREHPHFKLPYGNYYLTIEDCDISDSEGNPNRNKELLRVSGSFYDGMIDGITEKLKTEYPSVKDPLINSANDYDSFNQGKYYMILPFVNHIKTESEEYFDVSYRIVDHKGVIRGSGSGYIEKDNMRLNDALKEVITTLGGQIKRLMEREHNAELLEHEIERRRHG